MKNMFNVLFHVALVIVAYSHYSATFSYMFFTIILFLSALTKVEIILFTIFAAFSCF